MNNDEFAKLLSEKDVSLLKDTQKTKHTGKHPARANKQPKPEKPEGSKFKPRGVEGQYRTLKKATMREGAELTSKKLRQLEEKQVVSVVEVTQLKDGKWRGRVAKPKGWISIKEDVVELVKAKAEDDAIVYVGFDSAKRGKKPSSAHSQ